MRFIEYLKWVFRNTPKEHIWMTSLLIWCAIVICVLPFSPELGFAFIAYSFATLVASAIGALIWHGVKQIRASWREFDRSHPTPHQRTVNKLKGQ